MICVQTLKASAARPLRQVASFWVLFRCEDKRQVCEIADEVAGHLDKEQFARIFREATEKDHSFLTINLMAEDKSALLTRSLEEKILIE